MKKNININLFGTLYAIDEDACNLLESYLDNMRSYFARRDGGDEIADDIEHRVAEHLWSLKEQGQGAVDIDTVKRVIESIGNPAEVDGEDAVAGTSDSGCKAGGCGSAEGKAEGENGGDTNKCCNDGDGNDGNDNDGDGNDCCGDNYGVDTGKWIDRVLRHVRSHRFYRDGRDRIAGGVMSGLCHYCGGGDTLVWRVAAVLFVIVAFSLNQMARHTPVHGLSGFIYSMPFVLYIALWLLAPVARTTEERLCMKGDEVTPESLGRAVIAEASDAKRHDGVRRNNSIMGRMAEILAFCMKLVATVLFAVMSAFALAYFVCAVVYAVVGQPFLAMFEDDPDFLQTIAAIPMFKFYWVVSAVCCLVASLLPLLGTLRLFKSERKPVGMAAVATLATVWTVAVSVGILLFVLFGIHVERENDARYTARNTRNGIFLNDWNWGLLDEYGWQVSVARNIAHGTLYENESDDPLQLGFSPLCLRPEKSGVPVELVMSHSENADAGSYVLECMADCSLTDATLSVWSGGKCVAVLRLDGYGAAVNRPLQGVSWQESRRLPLFSEQGDSTVWVENVQVGGDDDSYGGNGGRSWHYLSSAMFSHDGGSIEYRLRVGQHDIKDGSAVCGRMWLAHVGIRKI